MLKLNQNRGFAGTWVEATALYIIRGKIVFFFGVYQGVTFTLNWAQKRNSYRKGVFSGPDKRPCHLSVSKMKFSLTRSYVLDQQKLHIFSLIHSLMDEGKPNVISLVALADMDLLGQSQLSKQSGDETSGASYMNNYSNVHGKTCQ